MPRVWGMRTTWRTEGDGEFFCPDCGGDRNHRRRTGRRRLVVLGVPVLPRGTEGPVVECSSCRTRHGLEVLERPTTTRLSALLREAVHTVTLAVLVAGGTASRPVREAAVDAVRAAGFADCTEEQLVTLIDALAVGQGRVVPRTGTAPGGPATGATVLAVELREALEPLAPHLAPAGREQLLLQGARIALADGPYLPAEEEVLAAVGGALHIRPEDTARLLENAARTPS